MTAGVAVIPAYNEGDRIRGVVEGAFETGVVDEVIVVDDRSTDDTADRVRETDAILLSNDRNRNYGGAIKRGYAKAIDLGAEAVYRLDADGQHDPAELHRFRRALDSPDVQYVMGDRFGGSLGDEMPIDRRAGNRVVALVTSLRLGQFVADPPCGYRAMDADYLARIPFREFSDDFRIGVEEILAFADLGAGIAEVPVSCIYADEESTLSYVDGAKFLLPNLLWWDGARGDRVPESVETVSGKE